MKFLLIVILATGFSAKAQILDKDIKLLSKPGGEELFELGKGEELYTYEPENDWYKVRKLCYVPASHLADDKYLNPGTKLTDKEGNSIGEALSEVEVKDKQKVEHFRKDDQYKVVLEGYVFKTAIEKGSIPENRLEELLKIKNRSEQEEKLEYFFSKYKFEERNFGDLTAHVLREENKSAQEEKDFRLIVIYRDKSSLFAFITNDHELEVPRAKGEFTEGKFKVQYLYNPRAEQKEVVENQILYTYLAL